MVYVVEDWATVEVHGEHGQGYYQVLGRGEGVEVRVKVGKLGYKKVFENPKDKLLERIMKFCGSNSYIQVSENIWDEHFFK